LNAPLDIDDSVSLGWGPARIRVEVLSGLTVAMALVPEAIAFAFVAGVAPLSGLYAAFIVGLITAIFGGRPGMISGATGALAVVMVSLVANHGPEYLFATVVLMGLIQLAAGLLHLGKFIRLVPYPVMLGFVNGLAIVIFLAQFEQFKTVDAAGHHSWMPTNQLLLMLGLAGLTMVVIWLASRFIKAVPAPLVGIVTTSVIVIAFSLDVRSVGDMASIAGGLPEFHIPMVPLTWDSLRIIFPHALILASIGLIESLLTLNLVAELTETHGKASQECIAQGSANIITGFFGGMGGCAMIGQSIINIKSGGRTRLAGIASALFLLSFILFASNLIEMIPLAALVGVMFMVVIGTFEWTSLRTFRKIPLADVVVMLTVTFVTVLAHDLATAVFVGVIISALIFAWQHATHIFVDKQITDQGSKMYQLHGPLFFASVASFQDLFTPAEDPDDVIIDFYYTRVYDQSGLQAINTLAEKYRKLGRTVHLRHLSEECQALGRLERILPQIPGVRAPLRMLPVVEIGRASCRERV